MNLEIKDEVTGNRLLEADVLEGNYDYPFWFTVPEGEVGLTAEEAKRIYYFLEEVFNPKIINE
ncbi:hypothetical protein [Citrobacter phage CVT22]|uniref:Uncharacterized protein n=1 Tax=Citrobacter phage CVT22 TaxID=1622234 RepID=A0A0R6CKR6_9CAUD|nr:hypothetical protein APL39_gp35 [Citrobacter phage CVT22]AJT60739.1 hypothetical protein [Citrobacter phage CVT22]